ncbi:succinate dehydrogenase assembly factor 2 [Afifella sp. IM 167]|uniref:FAD assembly factor SdhE n=1 Tax=Afifella sp. IM 167 TaxID=2033586 RepID=UPI001CCE9CB4|nr:succinate dehydrogenase assembly factor 2 [Afifella sp. IM 167]MBZ8132473.1 succinate dehydrogenase assembly factor 2 [Afifella sp. IM 167]
MPASAEEDIDMRRRRAYFRAWRRGTREMDLLVGRFADEVLPECGQTELDEFEALLALPDPSLYAFILGREEVPPNHDSRMIRALIAHHGEGTKANAD